jgi:hypothetical protein
MRLQTRTNTIISIVQYAGKIYYLSTGGVDVFTETFSPIAHVTTLGDTIGVNDYGLYIGGASGIYFVSHGDIGVGGDVTLSVVLKFTTGTIPALVSNTVWALAGKDQMLMIATDTTLQFLPDASLTTIYNTTNFGINKLSISNSQNFLALASDSKVYTMDIPTGAFSYADAREAEGITSIYFEPGIAIPAAIDTSTYYLEWMNSHPGQYLIAEGANPDYVRFFDWNNGNVIQLTVSAQPTYATWMTLHAHPTLPIVMCWSQAGFAYIYEIVGTVLTLQSTVPANTTFGQDGAWSTDGTHYVVVAGGTAALFSYIGTTLTYHGTFAVLANANRVVWSSVNPNICVIGSNNSAQIATYERVGNTLVHRSTQSLTSGCQEMSEDLGRIVATCYGTAVADVYDLVGTSLIKRTSLAAPSAQQVLTSASYSHQRGVAIRQTNNSRTWFFRALGGQVSFIPSQCGMLRGEPGVWSQAIYYWTMDHDKTIAFLHLGNAHIMCPIKVKEIPPLSSAINAIAAGDDVYIGTANGLAVRPRVIVKRNVAYMEHGLAIDQVAGTEGKNVTAVAVRGSATKHSGVMVYGHDTSGGSAGILDIGELSWFI